MYNGMGAIVASLWFLSAMFVVFPLYCWLLTRKKHLFIACEVFYVPVIYYGAFGFLRTAEYPYSLLRALSGLCVGTLVYYCKNYLNTTGHGNCKNSLVNVLIIVCLFMSLWGLNFSLTRLVFLLFFIGMSLLFSEKSSISFSSNVIDGLGKISGYVFLIHWTVGSVLDKYAKTMDRRVVILLYFLISIISACIAMHMTKWIFRRKKSEYN